MPNNVRLQVKRKAHVNPRLAAFSALFCLFGIFLYFRICFGGIKPSDFLFPAVFLFFAIFPLGKCRFALLLVLFVLFAGAGAGLAHWNAVRFGSGSETGTYSVMGTVKETTIKNGYSQTTLKNLYLDGEREYGNALVRFSSETVRAGDIVVFTAKLERVSIKDGDSYAEYLFTKDIRFTAFVNEFVLAGKSEDPFLRLNALIYDSLQSNVGGDEAAVAYALLTGNSGAMDEGLLASVRKGGIAHIFAVSGLHIGILFAATSAAFGFLRRYRVFPALLLSLCYAALCGFSVSSVRAFIMCAVLGIYRVIGRKTDFLQSIGFAALCVLVYSPAQWLSVGFRLSFGACIGLALFSGTISRAFRKLPKWLGVYLSALLSVQIFTLPVQIETFGYVSVWGFLLNFFVIPALPVLFLSLLAAATLSLVIPPAAAFFLAFPANLLSALLYAFSAFDFTFVLTGFTLGTGIAVYLSLCFFASERLRLRVSLRAFAIGVAFVLLCLVVAMENIVIVGCKIVTYRSRGASAVLIKSQSERVLVIDGEISLKNCEDFLSHHARTLDAVVVLAEDEVSAINTAAFLNTELIYARREVETGLQETEVRFAERFYVGSLEFRYESGEKLAVLVEDVLIEVDFTGKSALGADLFLGGDCGNLIFFIRDGIIKIL